MADTREMPLPVTIIIDDLDRARIEQAKADFTIMIEALELLVDLWPNPGHATVTLETHQWLKLRKVLVAMSRLWTEAYRT